MVRGTGSEPSIPLDVVDLTADWFAAVLDAPVGAAEVVDAHSGTTGRARVHLRYGDGRDDETVFVKLAPFDERQRAFLRFTDIGRTEARFYGSVGRDGTVPVRVPEARYSAYEPDGDRFVMVLEDLVASGATFPKPTDADIGEQAARIVDELAALHAVFWESPRFAGDLAWVPDRAGFGAGGGRTAEEAAAAGAYVARAVARLGGDMAPAFHAVGSLYAANTAAVLDRWDEGPRTLIHGDAHLGNQFRDGNRPGFYDWAMLSHSPGVRDVAYVLCGSVPADVRRATERDLLDAYRSALATRGVSLPADVIDYDYRLFAVFAWVSATTTAAVGSRWQPTAAAHAAMERATVAIDDLDCAGLLAELIASGRNNG